MGQRQVGKSTTILVKKIIAQRLLPKSQLSLRSQIHGTNLHHVPFRLRSPRTLDQCIVHGHPGVHLVADLAGLALEGRKGAHLVDNREPFAVTQVVCDRWTHHAPWSGRHRSPSCVHNWRIPAVRGRSGLCVAGRRRSSVRFEVF